MNEGIISKAQEQKAVATSKQPKGIRSLIKSMEGEIAKALPSVITPERFTRITLSALTMTTTIITTIMTITTTMNTTTTDGATTFNILQISFPY